jgi:cobalt-zinc-cadmium efflux system protein
MVHDHAHSHFGDPNSQTTKRLSLSLGLTAAFVIFEVLAGVFGNSLALLTDAAHNFTDVIALGLSWYALRAAAQPAHAGKTFGYHRVGILVALVNSTTLILISLGIFYEAWVRFIRPVQVNAGVLIGVGLVAFIINAGTAWLVKGGSEHDLNLRSTFLHLMGDVLSTAGAVIAGVIIYFTKANWLDPLVSVLIGLLILYNAWGILRDAMNILLESTPQDVDIKLMVDDLVKVEGVLGVHDLHVWSLTQSLRTMSAHILTEDISISAGADIQRKVNEVLHHRYNVGHATLQLECVGCDPDTLYCDITENNHIHPHEKTSP